MQEIIKSVPTGYLLRELTPEKLLVETSHGNNLTYVVTAADSPALMTEIGRLREMSFREAGGGTGQSADIDSHDLASDGYKQLIVWNPHEREIVGGVRFIVSHSNIPENLSTENYFNFSRTFRDAYLPYTIELGRSFIQPKYQASRGGVFALDNLWDGLGAVVARSPNARYLFGKVTIFPTLAPDAKELLYFFLQHFHKDTHNLVRGISEIQHNVNKKTFSTLFNAGNYQENFRILLRTLKEMGQTIPPLVKSYINLSPTMKVFGTVRNDDFGGVEETAILITIADIYPDKLERHFLAKEKLKL